MLANATIPGHMRWKLPQLNHLSSWTSTLANHDDAIKDDLIQRRNCRVNSTAGQDGVGNLLEIHRALKRPDQL